MRSRHNLVYISREARERALENIENVSSEVTALVMNENIPAIVTRQFMCDEGYMQCGVTSPQTYDDNRLRIGISVPIASISKFYTPFEVLKNAVCDTKKDVLEELLFLGNETGFDFGVYGSVAMELVTGLKYLNENSDIDIYIRKNRDDSSFENFYKGLIKLEEKYKEKIDGEIEVHQNFGVKIKEFFNSQKTVLAKGIEEVEIFEKDSLKQFL